MSALASRMDRKPPPWWLARVLDEAQRRYPHADLSVTSVRDLDHHLTWRWRIGDKPSQAALSLFSCDGRSIQANPDVVGSVARPPKGAKPGEAFGVSALRESAEIERLKSRIAKLEAKREALTTQIGGLPAQQARAKTAGQRAKLEDAERTARAKRREVEDEIQRAADQISALRADAHAPRRARPKVAAPRARLTGKASCPPTEAACVLGLQGASCGLPAALVLASARGAPIPRTARYCLTSVWRLIPSHNPLKGFAKNPDYPADVQERAYDRDRAEQLKVISIAQNLIPELILNGAPGAIDGLPVVNPWGIVLGGNGRTQGMQLHYSEGETGLRDYLVRHADQFGFSAEQVRAVPQPVVVRVIETPAPDDPRYQKTLAELVRLLNIPLTQSLDVRSETVAEARRLPDEVLDLLSVELTDDVTLSEYLTSPKSARLAEALRRAGVLTDRNVVRYLTSDGQRFSEDGRVFVERLLTGLLVPDAQLLDRAGPQLAGTLARSAPWLLSAAAAGEDWDLRPALRAALADLVSARREGARSIDAYLRQTRMDAPPAVQGVPKAERLLRLLWELGATPVRFARFAKHLAERARFHPTSQTSLFAQERESAEQILTRYLADV